ncbi:Flp pilus assembly complex ATPase component TadA [Paeniglutamicibacter antarcticus]|uniref:Flp pilus assembly complex ATPase component TadA n=1 Tax=Arthrobacter terrae TaxID=2935737 RepID=A0A931G9N6_9MICC|nr:ATPase, T2SS/T4P/T4SS family [Arthrobacter terrae]MBG0738867.1 Flp pilus assembly complex ATPase component TadA [Arthrobacter terrae]
MTATAVAPAPAAPAPEKKPANAVDFLLYRTLDMKGSDLHLVAGTTPWATVHGKTVRIEGLARELDPATLRSTLRQMVSADEWTEFWDKKRLDFSYSTERANFRGHFAVAGGEPMAVFRTIPSIVPDFDDLGLPEIIRSFIDSEAGLYLFIGVTGSGKSSSLAALIKLAKEKYAKKITTIEAPIEFRHTNGKSLVVQREVGKGRDVDSFAIGIEDALRENPDIILVGEMRDPETMSAALSATSSGHLVFSTLHAGSTADAPARILEAMPADRVADTRAQLARSLKGVVYQKLLPRKGGQGRVVATEVLMMNTAISNMIKNNSIEGIAGQLLAKDSGSIPFEVSLVNLVLDGIINESTALDAELTEGSYMRQKAAGRRS